MRFPSSALVIIAAIVGSACSYQPYSKQTGGYGQVLSGQAALGGAAVSITDLAGTLSAATDVNGRFNIPVESKRILHVAMANPMKHNVTITIEKDGVVLKKWQFVKGQLGSNYFDFGVIQLRARPNNSFKPNPLR